MTRDETKQEAPKPPPERRQNVAGPRCNAKNPPCEECEAGHA